MGNFKRPSTTTSHGDLDLVSSFFHQPNTLFSLDWILHRVIRCTSSRTATMAQIRGTAGYNLGGGQNTFGGPSRGDTMNDPSPLDAIREQTGKIEDFLDTLSDPIKPYVFSRKPTRPRP